MAKEIEKEIVTQGDDVCIAIDAEMFKDMFNLMSALTQDEVQIQIRTDGLYVQQMDLARVGLTIIFIPKSYFKILKQGQVIKEMRLAINDLKSILSRLSHGDVIQLTVTDLGKLKVEIQGKRIRTFELMLFEPEELERRVPKIPIAVRIKATMEGLLVAINDAKILTSGKSGGKKAATNIYGMITFLTANVGLKVTSSSDDGVKSSSTVLSSGWDLMQFEGGLGQRVTISLAYMTDVVNAISKVTNMAQLEYSTDMPVHLIAEMPLKGVILEYWLSPRIGVDDEKPTVEEVRARESR